MPLEVMHDDFEKETFVILTRHFNYSNNILCFAKPTVQMANMAAFNQILQYNCASRKGKMFFSTFFALNWQDGVSNFLITLSPFPLMMFGSLPDKLQFCFSLLAK